MKYTVLKTNVKEFKEGKYYVCRETTRPNDWSLDGEMDAHLDEEPRKCTNAEIRSDESTYARFEGIAEEWYYELPSEVFDEVDISEIEENVKIAETVGTLEDITELKEEIKTLQRKLAKRMTEKITPKIKVGDYVKIIENEEYGEDADKYMGEIYKVTSTDLTTLELDIPGFNYTTWYSREVELVLDYVPPKPVKTFKPIHLVLETEEEAKLLWHRLNISENGFKEAYGSEVYNNTDFGDLTHQIWEGLNDKLNEQEIKVSYYE